MRPVIEQNPAGYRYSMEPFLLADFVRPRPGDHLLEVGTGCGILPLLLLTREPALRITALEIQESLARRALANVKQNAWDAQVSVLHADFLEWVERPARRAFDWVLSNPPYRKQKSGRINPDPEKALARHEIALTLEQLVARGRGCLKPGGRMALACPLDRLEEVMRLLEGQGLQATRIRRVHGKPTSPARFFLVQAEPAGSGRTVEADDFFIYEETGAYSAAMQAIYASFNYPGRSHRDRQKRNGG